MSEIRSLREQAKAENKKMKDMTWEQKKEHILEYYKIHIISAIIAVASIIGLVLMFMNNNYNTVCKIVMIDGYITGIDTKSDPITKGFSEYIGADGKKDRVIIDNNFSLGTAADDRDSYYSVEKLTYMAASGEIDGFMTEYEYILSFSNDTEMFLADLSTVFTPQELSKISDSIIYYTKADGTKIPAAVDLSKTWMKTDTDLYYTRPCYGIVVTASNFDNAAAFIRYAFGL